MSQALTHSSPSVVVNYCTIGNSLIRVDALVGLLAIEEVGNKFDNMRNMSGTTDQDNFMHVQLVDLRVVKHLLGLCTITVQYSLYSTVVQVKHPYYPDFRFTN